MRFIEEFWRDLGRDVLSVCQHCGPTSVSDEPGGENDRRSSRDDKRVTLQGMKLALIGMALGVLGSFALTRVMKSLLFGVGPTDPVTFAVVPLLLSVVAFVACYIPARRATRVDPLVALRCE